MLVRFYLPDDAKDFQRLHDYCMTAFEDRYGGCTVSRGCGTWKNPNTGERVREAVHMFDVFVKPNPDHRLAWFDHLADYVRQEGEQDSVFYLLFHVVTGRTIGPDTIIDPN